ncbi:MAG: TetR family transcriptional regulator [Stappia sp.]|mgnify:CR=1 FL=1|nr:TetR family transcriptional regulator [Stappia sp.]
MGRRRTIDREAVLDAAERVVIRDGAARLTLDAVAVEAGISKASVLYDYGCKQALIRTVIERCIECKETRVRTKASSLDGPDAYLRARIALASDPLPDKDRALTFGLLASLAQDEELRGPIRKAYCSALSEVSTTAAEPRGAMLAFLALEGLRSLEWLGLHSWAQEERATLLSDIGRLLAQRPEPADGADVATGQPAETVGCRETGT